MRKLDAKVYEAVFGPIKWVRWVNQSEFDPLEPWDVGGDLAECQDDDEGAFPIDPVNNKDIKFYSTNADAALELIDVLQKSGVLMALLPMTTGGAKGWQVRMWKRSPLKIVVGNTLPEAICNAVLEAQNWKTVKQTSASK